MRELENEECEKREESSKGGWMQEGSESEKNQRIPRASASASEGKRRIERAPVWSLIEQELQEDKRMRMRMKTQTSFATVLASRRIMSEMLTNWALAKRQNAYTCGMLKIYQTMDQGHRLQPLNIYLGNCK